MMPTQDMFTSPYDRRPTAPEAPAGLVQLAYRPSPRWVPSRYNARCQSDDGRLMLWNGYTGRINVFSDRHKNAIVARLSAKGLVEPLDRTAQYLADRGFLVREGLSELDRVRYRYAQEQWRTDILQMILLASEDCNFRCVYCYEKFQRGTMTPEVREGVRALVAERAPRLRALTASWFGGEPLYGWEAIEDVSPYLKQVAERHNLHHNQHMTTNGYLLDEDRAGKLLSWGCRNFQITIDGLAEEHDCKRKGRDGSPTHQVILDNLRALRGRPDDFKVTIRVNFDQQNALRLGPFIESLSEDFSGDHRYRLRFRPVGKWGGANDDNLETCGVPQQRDVTHALRARAKELDLHHEGGIQDFSTFGSQVCYAARPYSFVIGASGKLMKCTIALDDLPENVVGQIHPDGRLELNDENMARWVNPHFESDQLCQHCHMLPGCQGSACPLTRITRGHRTCSALKPELKYEMRETLIASDRAQDRRPIVV